MAKKKSNNGQRAPTKINITIKAEARPDTPFYYVNYISVNHSPYDFTLSVLRLPSDLTPEQKDYARKGQPVPMEPALQLVIPPRIIKGLIEALSEQCRKYEDRFGKIIAEEVGHEKRKQK